MTATRSSCLLAATAVMASSPVSAQAPDTLRAGGQTISFGPAQSWRAFHAYLDFRFFTPGSAAEVPEADLRCAAEFGLFVEGYAPRPRPNPWSSDDPTPVVTVEVDLWPESGVNLRSSLAHPGRSREGGGTKGA